MPQYQHVKPQALYMIWYRARGLSQCHCQGHLLTG